MSNPLRPLRVVGGLELRSRARDGTALLVALIAPIMLASLFGLALGGDEPPLSTTIAIVDLDGGEFPASVQREALESEELEGLVAFTTYPDEAAADAAVDAGEVGAAIVFPPGFSDSVGSGQGGTVSVLESADAPLAGVIARSMVDQMSALVEARTLAVRASLAAGVLAEDVQIFVEENGAAGPPLSLAGDPVADGAVDMGVYYGAGMAVLFAYFVAGTSARSLLTERRNGTLLRLRAAPIPVWTVVAGKGVVGFSLALLSMVATWLTSQWLFGTSWGDPAGVLLLFVAHAFTATMIVMLAAGSARTDAQADGLILGVSFVLAFLGGSLVPLYNLPGWLQSVALITPNGRVAAGLTELSTTGAGASAVWGAAAVVALIGVLAGTGAFWRLRRGLTA
ncbi:ABC transporter permease [Isoptericola croceus]|uniref:ABC transporter permease n=1 Tax=Isoptericola croceus TaxID=3031406 RepID=UPI0023FA1DDD|nr:ABC transporter permease [Isoptericola croceus]